MAGFFKKALGVFVEFEEEQKTSGTPSAFSAPITNSSDEVGAKLSVSEAEKFEKYFDKLLDQANLPGPDYFEFHKMMETLEAHIADEKARFAATFASLSIQGLTKQTLIDTANKYKNLIEKDRVDFEHALNEKMKAEVGQRQTQLADLEKKIKAHSETIQRLTKEISDSQLLIAKVKTEAIEEENKLTRNHKGYQIANQALVQKIASDIQKIQTIL